MATATELTMDPSQNRVNLVQVMDQAPLGRASVTVMVLCSLVAVFDGMDAQIIAFAAPEILREFQFGKGQLGMIFSAGTAGMAAGAMIFGPLGDRYGRRLMTLITVVEFALFTGLTIYASTYHEFLLLRFLAGLGMGGAMPNAVTLTAEYSPGKYRRLMVTFMYSGFAVGGMLGGAIANLLFDQFGWRSLFVAGAALPLALFLALVFLLPESPFFLARARDGATGQLSKLHSLLRKICPSELFPESTRFYVPEVASSAGIASLFSRHYRKNTLLLWLTFFINLFVLFFLILWTPIMLEEIGISGEVARRFIIIFSFGGLVGAFILALLSNRFNARITLALYFFAAFAAVYCIGLSAPHLTLLLLFNLLMGLTAGAAQTGLYPVTTQVYAPANRVTGVGWAQAIGRIGSIFGPWIGGLLVATGIGFYYYYALFAIPLLIAGIAIWMLDLERKSVAKSG